MNCDQVFEVLTGGEIEYALAPDELDRHLLECPACARLYECLQPASELLTEAAMLQTSEPVFSGPWLDADSSFAEESFADAGHGARELSATALPRDFLEVSTVSEPLGRWLQMAAAILVGAAVGGLVYGHAWAPGGSSLAVTTDNPSTRHAARTPARLIESSSLAALELTEACLTNATHPVGRSPMASARGPRSASQLLAQLDVQDLACCTLCHAAGSDLQMEQATSEVARSCQACHTN